MPPKYPDQWKFDGCPYAIPDGANSEFIALVEAIAEGTGRAKSLYEIFKSAYGSEGASTAVNWALHDLIGLMDGAKANAARYLVSFCLGIEEAKAKHFAVPSMARINKLLAEHNVPLQIEDGNLVVTEGDIQFVEPGVEEDKAKWAFERIDDEKRREGTYGIVHKLRRTTDFGEFFFAMKEFSPSSFIKDRERATKRFVREVQALVKLQHRAIVPLLEAGLTPKGIPYILMPFVEGQTLRDALEGVERRRIFRVFDEIMIALQFAHMRGVLHRDLKPANILVRESDQQPQILDFGAAFVLDDACEEMTTTLIGTDAYVPDEVRRNPRNRTPKQDVFACGMMLYEVVARELPVPSDYKALKGQVEGFDELDPIIRKAIAPESRRYISMAEMELDFAEFGKMVEDDIPF